VPRPIPPVRAALAVAVLGAGGTLLLGPAGPEDVALEARVRAHQDGFLHERERFRSVVEGWAYRELLESRSYARLERELEALRRSERRDDLEIERAFPYLLHWLAFDQSLRSRLEDWERTSPDSPFPALARAQYSLGLAEAIPYCPRDPAISQDSSEHTARCRRRREHIAAGRRHASRAASRAPGCVEPVSILLQLAVLAGDPDEVDRLFERCQALALGRFAPHRAMLHSLEDRGRPSPALTAFAREAVARHPEEPALLCLVSRAHELVAFRSEDLRARLEAPEVAREVEESLAALEERFPRQTTTFRIRSRRADLLGDEAARTRWNMEAARRGDPVDQTRLASDYLRGAGRPRDVAEGIRWLRESASLAHPWAHTLLGELHARGKGVPRDPARAAEHLRRAARQGDPRAAVGLATLLEGHPDLAVDRERLRTWLDLAVEQEEPGAAEARVRLRGAGT